MRNVLYLHTTLFTIGPSCTIDKDLEPRRVSRETLLYMANNASCGVVKIDRTGNAATYYELRVKNAYVDTVPDRRCGRHFKRFARSGTFTYSPDCKNMTRPRR
uniref:Lipocalin n=1 Tax=Rhipicephalus zambeziensis TaxID=60191 RepID=A0A224YN42_9ACAR